MDAVEALVAADPMIKGIWCVPKYSNPTGCVYSDAVTQRLASLPKRAGAHFLVLWDNAYAVHDFDSSSPRLASFAPLLAAAGTEDQRRAIHVDVEDHVRRRGRRVPCEFTAGRQIDRKTPERDRRSARTRSISCATCVFSTGRLGAHMQRHAALIRPKFQRSARTTRASLGELDIATWTRPKGGYFISLDTMPGIAQARGRARARNRRDVDARRRYVPLRARSATIATSASRRPSRVSQTSKRPPMYSYCASNSRASRQILATRACSPI